MSPPRNRPIDATWTPWMLACLVLVMASFGAWLAWRGWQRPVGADPQPPEDAARIAQTAEKINPNDASAASLRRLPGLGPERVRAVIEYRQAHGPQAFSCAEDLLKVKGIGPATLDKLAAFLSLPRRGQPKSAQARTPSSLPLSTEVP